MSDIEITQPVPINLEVVQEPEINIDIQQSPENIVVISQVGTQGPQGPAGAIGPQGPIGNTGPQGPAGPNLVSNSTTTDINGILKGNGSLVSQAIAGTDYQSPLGFTPVPNTRTVNTKPLSSDVVLSTSDIAEGSNLYFTDERAQDSVGGILTDTATIDFTYNDAGNTISAIVIDGSITDVKVATGIDAAKIADGSVSNAEFQYINSLTSNAQTQINTKRDITSIVPIVYGGTGASTEPVARSNLGVSMTSLYSGGVVSGLGTAVFSVAAGLGYIVSQTVVQLEPTSVAVNFNAVTSVAPLYTRGVIYVNSAGTILQVDVGGTPLTQLFKKQNIILASYVVSGGVIISLPSLRSTSIGTPSKLEDLMEALGPLNLSGNIYSANGANLFLNKSAGETFQLKSNITNSLDVRDITIDVGASPISNAATAYAFRNGTGGFTLVAYTGVTPNLWDDGSGTPASVTGGRFTIQRIYYFNRSNSTIIYLGQTEYTTLAVADAAVGTEIRVVDSATTFGTFRSSLVVKHNTTDLTDSSKAVFFEASKFGASGAGSSSGTTTLQAAYNNSVTPEIITNATLGAVTVQRGSASDTDNVLEGKNGAGTNTFTVDGNGKTTTDSLVIGSLSGLLKSTAGTVSAATAGTDYENPLTFSTPLSRAVNTVSIPAATTLVDGHLTSTDWNIFNNKIGNSFETVSKNLREFPYTLTYTLGVLTSITYTVPSGTTVKTLNYTLGLLTSVVLSGTLPSGILTTKTLTYSSGVLTSVGYT